MDIPAKPDDFARITVQVVIDAPLGDIPDNIKEILGEEDFNLTLYSNHSSPNVLFSHEGYEENVTMPWAELGDLGNMAFAGLLTVFARAKAYARKARNTNFLSLS